MVNLLSKTFIYYTIIGGLALVFIMCADNRDDYILFTADWCGHCRTLESEYNNIIDVDTASMELLEDYNVKIVPSIRKKH